MIGRIISHYKILEKLGEGGMGIVYKALDTRLDRTVALKFLPASHTVTEQDKTRFIHEARAASALEHPHICTIHEIDETPDGQLFLVMPAYEGAPLNKKIEEKPLGIDETIDIAIQIADGLQATHEKGIIHRDIKSSNIFITQRGQVKVMDFGLARSTVMSQMTKTGTTIGTVPYMSPEQAQGKKVDHRTDIWSLGVILYEMISGRMPFRSDYTEAVLYSIINEEPEPVTGLRSGIPIALEGIIQKCLEKNPDDRYQHVDEITVDLRKIEKEISSGEKKISAEVRPPKKRINPWIYGIPVILLLIIGLYFFLPERTTSPQFDRSIAILPFQNLSADPAYSYFAGGLHDELLTQLAKVGALSVRGRTSVMGYAETTKSIREIARELNVATLVEGSVQVVGERLRVNVQLINTATDEHLWAESYDRTFDDAFSIQSDIAQQIVHAVGIILGTTEKQALAEVPTANPEAYRLYLRGREYLARGLGDPTILLAAEMFNSAVAMDPNFAPAYAALAKAHARAYFQQYDTSASRASSAERAARHALRLNPGLAEAHEALGWYNYWARRDWIEAHDQFTMALQSHGGSSDILLGLGLSQRRLGYWDEALDALKQAQSLDPLSSEITIEVGISFLFERRYYEAVEAFGRAVSLAPDHHRGYAYLAAAHIARDQDLDTAIRVLQNGAAAIGEAEFVNRQLDPNTNQEIRWLLPVLFPNAFARLSHADLGTRLTDYYLTLAGWHWDQGREEERRAYADSALTIDPASPFALAHAGRREAAFKEAQALLDEWPLERDWRGTPERLHSVARLYAIMKEDRIALDLLERWVGIRSEQSVAMLRFDPAWKFLRTNPRFRELLQHHLNRAEK
jgi:eukaryotic-like serine/threonine-protein kinase